MKVRHLFLVPHLGFTNVNYKRKHWNMLLRNVYTCSLYDIILEKLNFNRYGDAFIIKFKLEKGAPQSLFPYLNKLTNENLKI